MDLKGKISQAWSWIKSQFTETSAMIVVTYALGVLSALTGNIVLMTLALLSAFRWGQLDSTEIVCDRCAESLDEPLIKSVGVFEVDSSGSTDFK